MQKLSLPALQRKRSWGERRKQSIESVECKAGWKRRQREITATLETILLDKLASLGKGELSARAAWASFESEH